MPRGQKLKVFRTPIGFHDAYVAAPSQKAALEAWGSKHDLFSRGLAERVEDPELTREPLAHPGKVVRKLRGSAAEQIAALSKTPQRKRGKEPKSQPKPTPRPDRAPLDRAETALAEAEARQVEERAEFARREAELARERGKLEKRQESELGKLTRAAEAARERYRRGMRAWQG